MWLGNSVSFKWWNNFWLNEAFGRYYEVVLGQKVNFWTDLKGKNFKNIIFWQFYSSYEFLPEFIVKQMHTALEIDARPSTQAISSKEEEIKMPQDMNYITNIISYDKGASVLRMFSSAMGEDNFDLAVREYLQEK